MMTRSIKISLVGLSGSGKTTALKAISRDAYLSAETMRAPTEQEAEAWNVNMNSDIPTSSVPNFAQVMLDKNCKIYEDFSGIAKPGDISCMIFDTCGQEIFYQINQSTMEGSDGILFLIDSSIPINSQRKPLERAYEELISYCNSLPANSFNEEIPIVVICNKQDLVQKYNLKLGSIGKASFVKTILDSWIPNLKNSKYFNASAKHKWGIKEALECLISEIMESILRVSIF